MITDRIIILSAIDNLIKNRTTIVIAHRLSTIKKADKIIVLFHEGSLVEEGKHEELLNKSDTYKKLYNQEITS